MRHAKHACHNQIREKDTRGEKYKMGKRSKIRLGTVQETTPVQILSFKE